MPTYTYKVTDKTGKMIEGEKVTETRDETADALIKQGYTILTIQEKVGIDFSKFSEMQVGGIPLKEKVFFVKQLAAMLKAGLPIVQSIEIMTDQTKLTSMKNKLIEVYKDIKSGVPLARSFAKQDLIFDQLQLRLLEAGEESGNLIVMMKQISVDMQKSHQLKSKVRGALIYPIIILLVAIVVVIVLTVFMIPAVSDLYVDLGASPEDMPGITKMLVVISNFFTNPIGILISIAFVIGAVVGFVSFYKTDYGRGVVDKILLKMPIFGHVISMSQVLQMTRLLGMLLQSGLPIIEALEATAGSLGNIHFSSSLEYTAERVSKGSPISAPLAKSGVIPIMALKMIATGEDTGTLDKVLKDLTQFYEDEVDEITSNLTKLMEPLMLLVVGGLVAFLAIAVYLPIYSVSQYIE